MWNFINLNIRKLKNNEAVVNLNFMKYSEHIILSLTVVEQREKEVFTCRIDLKKHMNI
jgi:hypothetical protein